MIDRYRIAMEEFREATEFVRGAKTYRPTIATSRPRSVISRDFQRRGCRRHTGSRCESVAEYLRRFNEVRRRACVMLEPERQSHSDEATAALCARTSTSLRRADAGD